MIVIQDIKSASICLNMDNWVVLSEFHTKTFISVFNIYLVRSVIIKNVTGLEKTGLIYTKYTCSQYGTYFLFCMCYAKSISCIDILDTTLITDKYLLPFKLSKLGQILHVDKTGFLRPGNVFLTLLQVIGKVLTVGNVWQPQSHRSSS